MSDKRDVFDFEELPPRGGRNDRITGLTRSGEPENPVNPANPAILSSTGRNPPPGGNEPDEVVTLAETVTNQYRVVQNAVGRVLRESVRFGAILMEVEAMTCTFRGRGGNGTLKGWLEKHCPEVNYNTARSHKALAQKACALIGGTWLQAVTALKRQDKEAIDDAAGLREVLYGDENRSEQYSRGGVMVPDYIEEKCIALFRDVDSRRALETAYHVFSLKAIADDNAANAAEAIPKLSPVDEAKAIWTRVMTVIEKTTVLDSVPLLPEQAARVCLKRLSDLTAAVQRRLKELAQ